MCRASVLSTPAARSVARAASSTGQAMSLYFDEADLSSDPSLQLQMYVEIDSYRDLCNRLPPRSCALRV